MLAGTAVGLGTLAATAALGLTGVLAAVPALQLVVRVAGTAYLLWLAWGIARSGPPHDADLARPRTFTNGLLLLWLNPKAWAMTLGAAAAFGGAGTGAGRLAGLLGACFGLAAVASLTLWCTAGSVLARLLRSDRQWRTLDLVLAAVLAGSIVPMWA